MSITVRDATFDLLRKLDLNVVVGNPGSTEETFLANFPDDFTYILALQEASVIGIADGIAQGLKKPVIVNVHTGAGLGNAMGCIITAYRNKTPLIITAGQQTREMLLMEPFLTNVDPVNFPRPWVKWSYEPSRPEDVPGAFMRAYATAMQQPTGPVFLSLPLDDWNRKITPTDVFRTISKRTGPDPDRIKEFADKINKSKHPVLIYGADISRSNAWNEALKFAEQLNAPVWSGPFSERVSFPESHQLYQGELPSAIGPLSDLLKGHDLVIVIGAPVFRYYPWVPGQYLPEGAELIQIIDDPYETAKSAVGDSLVSDSKLAFIQLLEHVKPKKATATNSANHNNTTSTLDDVKYPLKAQQVFDALTSLIPKDYVLVQESPSNIPNLERERLGKIDKPDSYYTMSSGGLGWDLPAAVGLAFAEKSSGRNRPVILVIGDGSFQYSPQALWTAVQHELHIIVLALRNEEYGILKEFALLEKTPNVPGLDLPGLDIVSLAKGYGTKACYAEKVDEIQAAFKQALKDKKALTVIEIPINKKIHKLLG